MPLEIPEIVGEVHTLNASDVLLISGSKGYAIYDVDFKCIASMKLSDKTKYKILYVDSLNQQLKFVFDDGISKKISNCIPLEPRQYGLPKNLTKDLISLSE